MNVAPEKTSDASVIGALYGGISAPGRSSSKLTWHIGAAKDLDHLGLLCNAAAAASVHTGIG